MKLKPTLLIATLSLLAASGLMANPKTQAKVKKEESIPGVAPQPASFFYTGKPYDADLGAYTFNFRNYDPAVARWTTVDPSGFPDGVNNRIYAPVPTGQLDPNGLEINCLRDAMDFYAMNIDPKASDSAGSGLYSEIKNSSDYISMLTGLQNTINTKLGSVDKNSTGGTISAAPNSTRSLGWAGITLGGLVLTIDYSASWTAGSWSSGFRIIKADPVNFTFRFNDNWDFTQGNKNAIMNFLNETCPGAIATTYAYVSTAGVNSGTSFYITGTFKDSRSASATQYE